MKYKNVLCIYPYRRQLRSYGFCPPLGLEYIATTIEPLVEKITVIDMRFERDLRDFIDERTDLICISKNWGHQEDFFAEILGKIPDHILTIVGGRDATENVVELFEAYPNIDIVVRGDGEETMRELLEAGSPHNVAGLSYRENGSVIHGQKRLFSRVNDVPVNRKLRRYKYKIIVHGFDFGVGIDTVSTSRGCPYNCKFCNYSINPYGGKREWSARTPESVVDELKTINAELVAFVDDNFTPDMNRVERICDLILEERIRKKFTIDARIEIARRPDILAKMERAGFKVLLLGVESACDKSLKFLNKGFATAEIREAFRVLRKFNILYHGAFITGIIGEDKSDMLRISKFAKEIGVDTIMLNRLRADKYSPLREEMKNLDGYYIGNKNRVYSDQYPSKELKQIRRKTVRRFYTPFQIVKTLRKIFAIRLVDSRLAFRLLQFALLQFIHKLPFFRRAR